MADLRLQQLSAGQPRGQHLDARGVLRGGAGALPHQPRCGHFQLRGELGLIFSWKLAGSDTSDTLPDDHVAGQGYIELYQLDTTQTERLTHITNNANYWVSRSTVDYYYYADALHMSMPTFAKLTALTGDTNYAGKMYSYFHYNKSVIGPSNGLYSTTDHLWHRDTNFLSGYTASDGTKQKCYWSRGNGWVLSGLARTLAVLPTNDAHYAEYLQTFQDLAAAIKAVQRPDGFWNVNLAYANDYPGPESSGTSGFVYGMAWGINHGLLDRTAFLPAVINGWNALANGALHHSAGSDNGFLGYEQGTGDQPSSGQPVTYNSVPNYDDFGDGLFLLAGSEVYQLSATPGLQASPLPVMNNQVQLDFTFVTTQTNATFNLLEAGQLDGPWTTNSAAILTTNIAGYSYRFAAPRPAGTAFYRILALP